MAIQHRNIPDAERHPVKGTSTATAGQVLRADGAGDAAFVNPNSLVNITLSSNLEAGTATSQSPASTDTPLLITFGAGSSNADVSIAAGGTITILTAGVFIFTFNLNMGRTGNTGVSTLVARALVNDVALDPTYVNRIDTSGNTTTLNFTLIRNFAVNDTVKVQVIRDSGGTNDGGLIAIDPVLSGWATSSSASVKIQKITGAS